MAATEISMTKIPLNNGVQMPVAAALTAEGAKFKADAQDTKILIFVENSGSTAENITFKAGCGIQGVADLVVSVAAGKTSAFVLESGAFKNKGYVYATGATTLKIATVCLP